MKKTFFIFFWIPFVCLLNAQQENIALGRVIYRQETTLPGDEHKNGYATLLFNQLSSLYVHNSAPKTDSSFIQSGILANVSGDEEGFPIYKSHQEHQLFLKISCRQASKVHCIVRDTFGNIEWSLHAEHKRFGMHDCRRATGKFRGRTYEA